MDKCTNVNIEKIYLEVFGHPLYHLDCPLFFANMLYIQLVWGQDVDFSSKDVVTNVTSKEKWSHVHDKS